MNYTNKRTWSDEDRYSSGRYGKLATTLREREDAGEDIWYDKESGCYETHNSTILPDGTRVMDM